MRMIFIEIIVFSALVMLVSACATNLKDLSFHGDIDFEKDGVKEEMGIDFKM